MAIALMLVAATAVVTACGGSSAKGPAPVTIVLDWTPNPAHAGILLALRRGLDRSHGVALTLRTPSSSADGIRLLLTHQADLAVLDIHDVAIAAQRGRRLQCLMSIVGQPLASVIASPSVTRPRDLVGKSIAVTGAPADLAVARTIVAGDGGNPAEVTMQPSGFAATQALLAGRVAGAIGFWTEEGVTLSRLGRGFHSFKVDKFGAPSYPELVLCGIPSAVSKASKTDSEAVAAITEGTAAAIADPGQALTAVAAKLPGANPALLKARVAAVLGALAPKGGRAGSLDMATLRRWASWESAQGLVVKPPAVEQIFRSAPGPAR
jgi:ABC-type nitrate/sulfonate/bicarbonate transport system substrate-binding protein